MRSGSLESWLICLGAWFHQVAGGAGTIALEILAELRPPGGDLVVFIPVGGGGLISGTAVVRTSPDRGRPYAEMAFSILDWL